MDEKFRGPSPETAFRGELRESRSRQIGGTTNEPTRRPPHPHQWGESRATHRFETKRAWSYHRPHKPVHGLRFESV
jgi:hypothetical protein